MKSSEGSSQDVSRGSSADSRPGLRKRPSSNSDPRRCQGKRSRYFQQIATGSQHAEDKIDEARGTERLPTLQTSGPKSKNHSDGVAKHVADPLSAYTSQKRSIKQRAKMASMALLGGKTSKKTKEQRNRLSRYSHDALTFTRPGVNTAVQQNRPNLGKVNLVDAGPAEKAQTQSLCPDRPDRDHPLAASETNASKGRTKQSLVNAVNAVPVEADSSAVHPELELSLASPKTRRAKRPEKTSRAVKGRLQRSEVSPHKHVQHGSKKSALEGTPGVPGQSQQESGHQEQVPHEQVPTSSCRTQESVANNNPKQSRDQPQFSLGVPDLSTASTPHFHQRSEVREKIPSQWDIYGGEGQGDSETREWIRARGRQLGLTPTLIRYEPVPSDAQSLPLRTRCSGGYGESAENALPEFSQRGSGFTGAPTFELLPAPTSTPFQLLPAPSSGTDAWVDPMLQGGDCAGASRWPLMTDDTSYNMPAGEPATTVGPLDLWLMAREYPWASTVSGGESERLVTDQTCGDALQLALDEDTFEGRAAPFYSRQPAPRLADRSWRLSMDSPQQLGGELQEFPAFSDHTTECELVETQRFRGFGGLDDPTTRARSCHESDCYAHSYVQGGEHPMHMMLSSEPNLQFESRYARSQPAPDDTRCFTGEEIDPVYEEALPLHFQFQIAQEDQINRVADSDNLSDYLDYP